MSDALPIEAVLPALIAALDNRANAVLAAPPGAGKTTRVPLALINQPWAEGRILMLEPRRLAARAAAERLAEQLGERPGAQVGYRIRGEAKISKQTKIEVITEGILTRMLQSNPELPGISAILFDEIHERSIHSDFGLALCLEVQEALRPDLRLVAMSATLDTAAFARLMRDAPVIESEGRAFPVETRWLDRPWRRPGDPRRHVAQATADLVHKALTEAEGDILVFLPGAREIERVAGLLANNPQSAAVRPLYGALPFARQQAALRPEPGGRRIVLATSIAETSLTVPGIRIVVDAGLARRARVDPATGLSRLVTVPVSRAEAEQRRGRAGRLAPGLCFRLWTKGEEGGLPAYAPPEITETDLAGLALEMAVWGASDPTALAFLTSPPAPRFQAARDLLADLGALDPQGRITGHGRAMAAEPVHPRLAHMLLSAGTADERATAAWLAALLTEADPLPETGVDIAERLKAIGDGKGEPRRLAATRQAARRLAPKGKPDEEHAGRLLALAYPDRIALRRQGGQPRFLLSGGRGAVMDAQDPLAGQRLLVAADLEDGREARIRRTAVISEAELRDVLGPLIVKENKATWSERTGRVEARRQERLGAIALSDEAWRDVPPDKLGAALADGVRARGVDALPWSKAAIALRDRVAWLRRNAGHGGSPDDWPDWSDTALLNTLDTWLTPHLAGKTRLDDLSGQDWNALLLAGVGWDTQKDINRLAPAKFETPLGAKVAVDYSGESPSISVRLQEMFGTMMHPSIGQPPRPLVISLLSPAGRPVQTTQDLPGFWRGSYKDVRKDMRARYPKHPWPEEPWAASPTRRAKPRPGSETQK